MFEGAISGLNDILKRHSWAAELAGILPLSALIDFVDVPKKLHVFELAGAVPLWSWPVTPAGSRLLLSNEHAQKTCFLDRYGNSVALIAIDGRYGDQYTVSSPETVRMCISSQSIHKIQNCHDNMSEEDLRIQNLEIIYVSRARKEEDRTLPSHSRLRRIILEPWLAFSYTHLLISGIGWIMLLGMIILSGIFQCYLSIAFLILIPVTGTVLLCLYGSTPRRLLKNNESEYNRLIIVAKHMNAMDWTIYYGESTILNSLLNKPLEPVGSQISGFALASLRMALRILIVGQWGLVLGSAALKDWNAYFITFWIVICIFSHAYLVSPVSTVKDWIKFRANINLERYQTQLSSRRALLNTIIALNPDTFSWDKSLQQEDRTKLDRSAMKWVDPILATGSSRTEWEDATRIAMDEALQQYPEETLSSSQWQSGKGDVLLPNWDNVYPSNKTNFWKPFILEGIYMAAKIKKEAKLSGRKVEKLV